MAELTKMLHFLKSGTEQTAKAYSTTDEAGDNYVPLKIDGVACYASLTSKTSVNATNGMTSKPLYRYVKRNYYKKEQWTQPVITSNGSLGGNVFAVEAYPDASNAYKAFDADTKSYVNQMNVGATLTFYNPEPIMITKMVQTGSSKVYNPRAGILQYSDDGFLTWGVAVEWSGTAVSNTYSVPDVGFHKYWRIEITQKGTASGNSDLVQVAITALVKTLTTQDSYDEYEDVSGTVNDYDYKEILETESAIAIMGVLPYTKIEYTTPGTYSFTVPTGVTSLKLIVAGGGGSSGECTRDNVSDGYESWDVHYHAGAGGRGGLFKGNVAVTPNTTYSIVVGAGGVAAKRQHSSNGAVGNDGNQGGTSSFGSLASATGGGGGGGGHSGKGNGVAGTPIGAGGAGGAKCTVSDESWSYGHSVAGSPGWVYIEYGGDI